MNVNLEPLESRVAAHLDHPAVADWALSVLEDFRTLELTREAEELAEAWFRDPERVARWVAGGHQQLIFGLLLELPPWCFGAAVDTLAERWPSWSEGPVIAAARVLAALAPERAIELFRQALEREPGENRLQLLAIAEAAGGLGAVGARLSDEALSRLALGDEPRKIDWLAPRLHPETGLGEASTLAALLRWLRQGNFEDGLAELSHVLFGHAAWFSLASDLAAGTSLDDFSALLVLFDTDAPLDDWDRLLRAEPESALPELVAALEAEAPNNPRAHFAARLVTTLTPNLAPEELCWLSAFAVATLAAEWEAPLSTLSKQPSGALLFLADHWLPTAPFHRELYRCLAAKPRREVLDMVRKRVAVERSFDLPLELSPRWLEAVSELAEPSFAPLFVDAMHKDASDEALASAAAALVRLGDAATSELIRRWDQLDSCQHIYGLDVLAVLGGQAVVDFFGSRFEVMADELDESFGSALLQQLSPSWLPKLADRLEDENPRWACDTLVVAAELLEATHPRLEEARERWQRFQEDEWAAGERLAHTDPLRLPLTCTACGHRAFYRCYLVFWSLEPDAGAPLVADEFPCGGCGELTDLVPAPETWPELRVTLEQGESEAPERPRSPPVQDRGVEEPNGESVSLSTLITRLRKRVVEAPNHLPTLLDFADAQRAANRLGRATNLYRRVLALNPAAIEAFWGLAGVLVEQEQLRAAFTVLRRALEHEPRWHFALPQSQTSPGAFRHQFAELFQDLRRRLASDAPPAPQSLFAKQPKVGRNDPCPCGSGKKFKRCCGG